MLIQKSRIIIKYYVKKIRILLIGIFSFASISSYASMCTAHSSNDDNKTISKVSFDTPCEISDTVLMASSEDVCLALKEKISNHDHD